MSHVVLLGDSIFDNAAYTAGAPDVRAQVGAALPPGWKVSLLAVDGSLASDVVQQITRLPVDATHLIVSAGGNDALAHGEMLTERAESVAEVLHRLAGIGEAFQRRYGEMVQALLSTGRPTVLSTVYYPRFPEVAVQGAAVTALTIFNDVILRAAFTAGVPLIDLRLICTEDSDYANPIEPSAAGGAKIAAVIARAVLEHAFARRQTEVFG